MNTVTLHAPEWADALFKDLARMSAEDPEALAVLLDEALKAWRDACHTVEFDEGSRYVLLYTENFGPKTPARASWVKLAPSVVLDAELNIQLHEAWFQTADSRAP